MRPAYSLLAALGLTVTTVGAPATLAQSTATDAPAAIAAQGAGAGGGGASGGGTSSGGASGGGASGRSDRGGNQGGDRGGDGAMTSQPAARPMVGRARLMSDQDPMIRGNVLLRQTGPNQTAVIVTVYGLPPGSEHVNHIHNGSCTGNILFPLEKLVADKTGVARSVSSVAGALNPETWWVNVHAGYALPSPGITCGQVESPPARARRAAPSAPRPEGGDRPSAPPAAPPGGSERR
jgi:hypothetical protein